MNKDIYNFETGETREQYVRRCGIDRCHFCNKDVPKDWGRCYAEGVFECVRCEELREDARRDTD